MKREKIKFVSIKRLDKYKNYYLLQNINFTENYIGLKLDEKIINHLKEILPKNNMLLLSNNININNNEIKDVIMKKFKKNISREIIYIIKKFNINYKNFYKITMNFFIDNILKLDIVYLIRILNSKNICKKSLRLSILSFYFSLTHKANLKQIEDIFIASMLINLNLVNFEILSDIDKEDYLVTFKKFKINNMYYIIENDKDISNNVKRIIRDVSYNYNSINDIYVDYEGNAVIKDLTLNVIQMSEELLSYNLLCKESFICKIKLFILEVFYKWN